MIIRSLKKRIAARAVQEAAVEAGLTHRDDILANDVPIVGYPKSGNTWLQIMLASVVFSLDIELAPFSLMCEAVPDLADCDYFRRHAGTMFFKSHDFPKQSYRKLVYLLRDGRDVMVSYRHHREISDKRNYDMEDVVSAEMNLWPCQWHQHVDAWAANPYDAEIILVRYEDLVAEPARELKRILRFAGVARTDAQIDRVVQSATLEKLREKETTEGAGPVRRLNGSKTFFRRGKVGSYENDMSAAALSTFLSYARPTLERCGYISRGETSSETLSPTAALPWTRNPADRSFQPGVAPIPIR